MKAYLKSFKDHWSASLGFVVAALVTVFRSNRLHSFETIVLLGISATVFIAGLIPIVRQLGHSELNPLCEGLQMGIEFFIQSVVVMLIILLAAAIAVIYDPNSDAAVFLTVWSLITSVGYVLKYA